MTEQRKRGAMVQARVTEGERAALERWAKEAGVTLSEVVRLAVGMGLRVREQVTGWLEE